MNTVNTILEPEKRPTILLAEDDPDQSDSLREVLEHEGYVVETVFSGDMALLRLDSHRFFAAIMDARMPGLHGGTVLKVCRLRSPQVNTPIIMVSAFASPRDLDRYKKDGAYASFTKPLDVPELLKCVRTLADDATRKTTLDAATMAAPITCRTENAAPRVDNPPPTLTARSVGRNECSNSFTTQGRFLSAFH
ncbi:MAG: response regulator [Planctomycetota bacterium]